MEDDYFVPLCESQGSPASYPELVDETIEHRAEVKTVEILF